MITHTNIIVYLNGEMQSQIHAFYFKVVHNDSNIRGEIVNSEGIVVDVVIKNIENNIKGLSFWCESVVSQ